MSLPVLPTPNPDLTDEQALNMILGSIAMEEVALSHIINSEAEKIQKILSVCPAKTEDILAVNASVKELLEIVIQSQMITKNKMEKILSYLSGLPDNSENTSCAEIVHSCKCPEKCMRFTAINDFYCSGMPILWKSCTCEKPISKISVPFNGDVTIDLISEINMSEEYAKHYYIQLQIMNGGAPLFNRTFHPYKCNCSSFISGSVKFCLPKDCKELSVCAILYAPCKTEVKKAELTIFNR